MKPDSDGFIKMSMAELTTPEEGRKVYMGRWWQVTDNNEVLFYKSYSSPQCNVSKALCESVGQGKTVRSVFIPVAYVPFNWNDFR